MNSNREHVKTDTLFRCVCMRNVGWCNLGDTCMEASRAQKRSINQLHVVSSPEAPVCVRIIGITGGHGVKKGI